MPQIKPTVRILSWLSKQWATLPFRINNTVICSFSFLLQALRFYGSRNVTVTGITIQNSPQCHLKFDNCEAVQVFNMTISSPGSSLNTDGIHLQNSRDVSIHHTDLGCGNSITLVEYSHPFTVQRSCRQLLTTIIKYCQQILHCSLVTRMAVWEPTMDWTGPSVLWGRGAKKE